MKTLYTALRQRLARAGQSDKGQSLVETALFFPILILIIVGVVEVGYLLNTYLAVANAAREGARYGATVGTETSDDATITSIITSTMTSKGLDVNAANTSIYVVRGGTNITGTLEGPGYWDEVWTYGVSRTVWIDRNEIAQEVGPSTEFVLAMAFYDHKTMLGMEWENLPLPSDVLKIAPYTAMRRSEVPSVDVTAGCSAYPITTWIETPLTYKYRPHAGDILADAQEKDRFELREIIGEGAFGWLAWRDSALCTDEKNPFAEPGLEQALRWPGTSAKTDDDGCWWGYINPHDSDDHDMNIGDWVWSPSGNIAAAGDIIDDHIENHRLLRVIIYDFTNGQTGSNKQIQIARFALVYLIRKHITTSDKYIEAEFYRWDDSCGAASGPAGALTMTNTPSSATVITPYTPTWTTGTTSLKETRSTTPVPPST